MEPDVVNHRRREREVGADVFVDSSYRVVHEVEGAESLGEQPGLDGGRDDVTL